MIPASSGFASIWAPALFMLAHVPLALMMDRTPPTLATVHAVAAFAFGAWSAVSRRIERVVQSIGYLVGGEVLWRMTNAQVNWEFGKYAAAGIMLLALARSGRLKPPVLPIVYFMLLIPSAFLTLGAEPWNVARDQLSFNLSGPFALMVGAWFFSTVELSWQELRLFFVAVISPVVGIAALAASGTFSGADVLFSDSSNAVTSGGFGPNQVSAVLGLGSLLALFIVFDRGVRWRTRALLAVVCVGLGAQAALTFSRGGLYMAVGGAAVAVCFALRDARLRTRLLPFAAAVLVMANYFVVPYLDAFTAGELATRFQDTRLTGRDVLVDADINLWKANPTFGVGPGEGREARGAYFLSDAGATVTIGPAKAIAAHTEFSRLLAEHGVFGLSALCLLLATGVVCVRRAPNAPTKAVVAGAIAWSTLFMLGNAMRILAPSIMFGLGLARFVSEHDEAPATDVPGSIRRAGQLRRLVSGHPWLKEPASQAQG